MEFFYSSWIGGIHSFTAVLALLFGAVVVTSKKGTGKHKKIGYAYVVAMVVLNISAIPLNGLFGGAGWFHLFILMSLPYILIGLYFPIFRRSDPNWKIRHLEMMSYSYVGLLAAFVAELFIRVPLYSGVNNLSIYIMGIFVVSGVMGGIGFAIIQKTKRSVQR